MRVLIIPEDPTLDQHVLKPIVERIFADLQRSARVEVLQDPHLRGVAQALNKDVVDGIIADNRMIDLFLILVDRDCDRMGNESAASTRQSDHADRLIAALAWQEVEVWALAPHRDKLGASWGDVRTACDPKERYFDPFIDRMGWLDGVGKGRKRAMRDLGQSWNGMLQVCPELANLRDQIQSWLERKAA